MEQGIIREFTEVIARHVQNILTNFRSRVLPCQAGPIYWSYKEICMSEIERISPEETSKTLNLAEETRREMEESLRIKVL